VDADNRWPGRWTAHTASVHAHGRTYLIRITPGDHATYLAPGFYADIDGGYGQHWAINTRDARRGQAPRDRGRPAMSQPTATPADVEASAAKDRHTLSETACDLIVIEHRLRDVRRWTPETARAHLDVALSSVATALDALHAEHTHRTTEREQS
jgi:hypothetical protein